MREKISRIFLKLLTFFMASIMTLEFFDIWIGPDFTKPFVVTYSLSLIFAIIISFFLISIHYFIGSSSHMLDKDSLYSIVKELDKVYTKLGKRNTYSILTTSFLSMVIIFFSYMNGYWFLTLVEALSEILGLYITDKAREYIRLAREAGEKTITERNS